MTSSRQLPKENIRSVTLDSHATARTKLDRVHANPMCTSHPLKVILCAVHVSIARMITINNKFFYSVEIRKRENWSVAKEHELSYSTNTAMSCLVISIDLAEVRPEGQR